MSFSGGFCFEIFNAIGIAFRIRSLPSTMQSSSIVVVVVGRCNTRYIRSIDVA